MAFSVASILGMAAAAGAQVLPMPELDLPAPKEGETTRTAVFAGGCFWCTEAAFEQLEGVLDVTSGYCGDVKGNADYKTVCAGTTKHAESIRITYDPRKISYAQLLQVLFTISEPTVKDKQGPDAGHQYRMAIFFQNDDEKRVAQAYIDQLTKAKVFEKKIETTVEPIGHGFFEAEKYHQDYVVHNPNQPYVASVSIPKRDKTAKLFPDLVKKR